MSALQAMIIAGAIACGLNFAVTGVLNEADIPTGARTPCDAPNRPQKKVRFVHGTSLASAMAINFAGVDVNANS